jgi:hypothetical protein
LLDDLRTRRLCGDAAASAIVRLGKAMDAGRLVAARNVVATYLEDEHPATRREAVWFLVNRGKCTDLHSEIERVAVRDPDVVNRGYAAVALCRLATPQTARRIRRVLAAMVANEHEDSIVRMEAYAGLLIAAGRRGPALDRFETGVGELHEIDSKWVAEELGEPQA